MSGIFEDRDGKEYCVHGKLYEGQWTGWCERCDAVERIMASRGLGADMPNWGESDIDYIKRIEREYVAAGLLPPLSEDDDDA